MSEWWSYGVSDFLLFSPRTYYRLFELYNAAIWPAQVVAVGLGLAIAGLVVSPRANRGESGRWISAILVLCWLWVAVFFHLRHYATIQWAARWFAGAFVIEAALLAWMGIVRRGLVFDWRWTGGALFLGALIVHPVLGPLLGRRWSQVELFGVAPDPTAVATLGLLLLAHRPGQRGRRAPWALFALPVLWSAVSGATLWAMKSPDFWVLPLAALFALVVAAVSSRARPLPPRPAPGEGSPAAG